MNKKAFALVSFQASVNSNLLGLVKSMRPQQWIKNVIIYAPLVFDGELFEPLLFMRVTLVVVSFSLVASSVYLMNDLVDMDKDRQHPLKRHRPLASGQLSPHIALVASVCLAVAGLGMAVWLEVAF